MPKRAGGVPGMAGKSFAIPVCSDCSSQMQRNDAGEWFCLKCADEWLGQYVEAKAGHKSLGGVVLPRGVRDLRRQTPSFRDLMPNRRTRRRMKSR